MSVTMILSSDYRTLLHTDHSILYVFLPLDINTSMLILKYWITPHLDPSNLVPIIHMPHWGIKIVGVTAHTADLVFRYCWSTCAAMGSRRSTSSKKETCSSSRTCPRWPGASPCSGRWWERQIQKKPWFSRTFTRFFFRPRSRLSRTFPWRSRMRMRSEETLTLTKRHDKMNLPRSGGRKVTARKKVASQVLLYVFGRGLSPVNKRLVM